MFKLGIHGTGQLNALFPETQTLEVKRWRGRLRAPVWCFCFPVSEGAVLPVSERRGEERTAGVQCSTEERSTWKRNDQAFVQSCHACCV